MVVKQAAKFSAKPKGCHETAVKRTRKFLLGTSNEGLSCEPNLNKDLEAFVDTHFVDGFNTINA